MRLLEWFSHFIRYLTYKIYRVSQKKRTFRMLQSVLGSKTLSGHNDRNLRMRTWVRSAVFDLSTLCSILNVRFFGTPCTIECSEKHKSFKLKIPQPNSERCHSPDFRTVFVIMIGPFSFFELAKHEIQTNK